MQLWTVQTIVPIMELFNSDKEDKYINDDDEDDDDK